MIRNLTIAILAALFFGCATTPPRPPPLTQTDIISMVKGGLTEEDIMRRIDGTRTVFRLSSEEVVRLRNEGVPDRIVNYMLDTYTRAVLAEQRRRDRDNYDFHYSFGFFHGHPWHH